MCDSVKKITWLRLPVRISIGGEYPAPSLCCGHNNRAVGLGHRDNRGAPAAGVDEDAIADNGRRAARARAPSV